MALKTSQGNKPCIFPVGYIYLSVNSTDPSEIFGGTWVRIAKGRTLVGVDENDEDFNTVQKIGGNKSLQKHTHVIKAGSKDNLWVEPNIVFSYQYQAESALESITTNEAGTGDSGNLQPYFTCYMWVRTA